VSVVSFGPSVEKEASAAYPCDDDVEARNRDERAEKRKNDGIFGKEGVAEDGRACSRDLWMVIKVSM
jgi:hypothetical protein